MIQAILFDLYETLITERGATLVRASSLGERLGLDGTAFRNAWKPQRVRVIRGEISFADALQGIGEAFGDKPDPALVRAISDERRLEKAAFFEQVDQGLLAVLRQLRTHGIKLAVVSNCFAEDVDAWPKSHIAHWFDASVFSFDVRAAKPEPAIYHEALRRLDVERADAVYVGDGGDDELLGAERAGLRAAQARWFRSELAGLPKSIARLPSCQAVLEFVGAG